MENNRMIFELSPKQVKAKNILSKDFLELEIWAISDINPNRNKTHFTLEGMQKALPTFKNKPILGFFDKGDFVEHNGRMNYDPELQEAYWDTEYGERILGFIRESDTVEIVEKEGLHWIRFTCVLCVQYCYKQVKKLLKDKFKKVSVEIAVRDSESIDGIEHIKDFNLLGTTILGSKKGVPVIEGIPGAHLSLIEKLDEAVMERQKEALCFAYSQIDDKLNFNNDNQNSKKEENAMEMEQEKLDNATNPDFSSCEPETECNAACEEPVEQNAEQEACGEPEVHSEEEHPEEAPVEGEDPHDPEDDGGNDEDDDDSDDVDHEACGECEEHPEANCDYVKLQQDYEQMKADYEARCAECDEYKAKCEALQAKLDECGDYAEIKEKLAACEQKLCDMACEEMKNKAYALMADEAVSEEDKNEIVMKCEKNMYASESDLEKDVAYAIFKARSADKATHFKSGYVGPIANVEAETDENKNKKSMTRDERLANYAAGKKNIY